MVITRPAPNMNGRIAADRRGAGGSASAATEQQVSAVLNQCASFLGSLNSDTRTLSVGNVFELPGATKPSSVFGALSTNANDLAAGIENIEWFDRLTPAEKSELLRKSFNRIDNRTNDPRDGWLSNLFAAADAAQRGCPDAERVVRDWSLHGASWTGDADFEKPGIPQSRAPYCRHIDMEGQSGRLRLIGLARRGPC